MRYKMVITPAPSGKNAELIDDFLESIGYIVCGGGVFEDGSSCTIRFEGEDTEGKDCSYQKTIEVAR